MIYDREAIRQELDSPSGFAARYQYLDISLSEEEQRTFFATWGETIQQTIANSIGHVEASLARIEFQHALSRPIRQLAFTIELADKTVGTLNGFVAAIIISPQAMVFRKKHPLVKKFHTICLCVRSNCQQDGDVPGEGHQESGYSAPLRDAWM